ncbi:MAG: HAMP domain-containing histidine kinase [Bacteroidales bacterium]|nr:HAMP domain-containing histidine kinase [Bacteroidales bacterium]
MKKSWIWITLVFIGLVMSGLIFFQFYWIKNSFSIKEQQFDQLVIRTLSEIALAIQKQEAREQVITRIDPAYIDSNLYRLGNAYSADTPVYNENMMIKLQHDIAISDEQYEKDIRRNSQRKDKKSSEDNNKGLNHEDDQTLYEPKATELLNKRKALINSIIENMFRFSPRIENRISKQVLEEFLRKTFADRGITLPFEFAVTKWNTMTAFKSHNFVLNDEIEYYKVQLFPDDFYSESNYLLLYFPDKKQSIVKSLGFMAIASISLAVILIIGFTLTVFIIFRQKRLSEIRSDFVSNMTHELKTPISTISLASQMLTDPGIPNESKNVGYLSGIISEESRKLGFQVEKVLQLAIFEKGNLDLKFKMCDIHEIITNVINTFNIQVKHKEGAITPALTATNYTIQADQVHITNVFSNLLDNAIKYCEVNPDIKISSRNENGHLIVEVKDNGIGMNRQELKKIFEKFYRIPTGNIHTVKGFGLGLSYVKKIVDEHKGHIDVESQPYEGSTFKIYLPVNNNIQS